MAARIQPRQQQLAQRVGGGGRFIGVGNAQAAAQVNLAQRHAGGLDGFEQIEHALQRVQIRRGLGDLRADVAADACHAQPRQRSGQLAGGQGVIVGDAELVVAQAGGDVGVRARVHVRIDADAHGRRQAAGGGHVVEGQQLGFAFHVEAANARLQRGLHLAAGLAHAGKDDFSRLRASGQRARQLAAGDDVKPAAGLRQQAENGLRGIGLDGVAHQRVAPGQPALPGRQRAFNGRLRVNEKRSAVLLGQLIQAKVFNHQRAVFTAVKNRRAGQGK